MLFFCKEYDIFFFQRLGELFCYFFNDEKVTKKSPSANPEQAPTFVRDQFDGPLRYMLVSTTAPVRIAHPPLYVLRPGF